YALAAAVIQRATWLHMVPAGQQMLLTNLTYVALSIIPLVSLLLAVVDVDLDRGKQGMQGGRGAGGAWGSQRPQPKAPNIGGYTQGYQATQQRPAAGSG